MLLRKQKKLKAEILLGGVGWGTWCFEYDIVEQIIETIGLRSIQPVEIQIEALWYV